MHCMCVVWLRACSGGHRLQIVTVQRLRLCSFCACTQAVVSCKAILFFGMFCPENGGAAFRKYKFITCDDVNGQTYWVYAHCSGLKPWVIFRKSGTVPLQLSVLVGDGVVKVQVAMLSGNVKFERTFGPDETVRVRDVRGPAIEAMVAEGSITYKDKVIIFIHPCKKFRHSI